MSFPTSRCRRRTTAGCAVLCALAALWFCALPAAAEGGGFARPAAPAGPVTKADLANLDGALDAAVQAAQSAADDLFQAAAQTAGVRIAIDEASARADLARDALTERIRTLYMAGKPGPMSAILLGLGDRRGLESAATAAVQSDQSLIDEVDLEQKSLGKLRHQAAGQEKTMQDKARRVSALQDRALALLTSAQQKYAGDQLKLAALAARKRAIEVQVASTRQAVLPGITPAVSAQGGRAAQAQAPIIAALEAAGANFPPGYRATGRTIVGQASWYGPGFYGRPTATGAPYDAERFTAAMLAVPLGTVVRVTTADGKAVNVLVNDRGPYVGGRIIDMSAAGARMLGYSGVKQVTVEVLEPLQ